VARVEILTLFALRISHGKGYRPLPLQAAIIFQPISLLNCGGDGMTIIVMLTNLTNPGFLSW